LIHGGVSALKPLEEAIKVRISRRYREIDEVLCTRRQARFPDVSEVLGRQGGLQKIDEILAPWGQAHVPLIIVDEIWHGAF